MTKLTVLAHKNAMIRHSQHVTPAELIITSMADTGVRLQIKHPDRRTTVIIIKKEDVDYFAQLIRVAVAGV